VLRKFTIWKHKYGQNLIEYALMAGFVALAAGAIMPGIADTINSIFSKIAPGSTGLGSPHN
jgi:Flp pilus assembly pilin Flp